MAITLNVLDTISHSIRKYWGISHVHIHKSRKQMFLSPEALCSFQIEIMISLLV